MDQAQAKPIKKRRRWLIVTVVLVLLASVSWWYWPRGDARFVGKWSRVTMGTKWADRLPYFHFYRNGGGVLKTRVGFWEGFSWWMEDGGTTLCFRPDWKTGSAVVRLSIVEVTGDRILYRPLGPSELVNPTAPHDFVLVRRGDDIPPEARVTLSNFRLPADSPPGSLVGELAVVGCDFGPSIKYSLADGGTSNDCFEVSGHQLRTRQSFEYTDENSINVPPEVNRRWVSVRAEDQDGRRLVSVLSAYIQPPSQKSP